VAGASQRGVARYHFVTEMRIVADRTALWDELHRPAGWSWWRWLKRASELEPGPDGGARTRFELGTALPYSLTFIAETVREDPPSLTEWSATGDLAGSALWEFTEEDGVTDVRFTWLVETTKRWMNVVAPVARPAFSWNHDVLMRGYARGLAGAVGGQLVSVRNSTVAPGSPGFGQLPRSSAR
jgi:hypothetical protein